MHGCRGGVYANNDKFGDHFVHLPFDDGATCDCRFGSPCLPYLNSSIDGETTFQPIRICDNNIYPVTSADVSGPAKMASPANACDPLTVDLTGHVAIVLRGICAFQTKLDNAVAAGAIAVVLVNSADTTGCGEVTIDSNPNDIPYVMISNADGQTFIDTLDNGGSVWMAMGPDTQFNYDGTLRDPFGFIWGQEQGMTIIPFSAERGSDATVYNPDGSLGDFVNSGKFAGFTKRPDDQVTDVFMLLDDDTHHGIMFRLDTDGTPLPLTNPFKIPDPIRTAANLIQMFIRNQDMFWTFPSFFTSEATLYLVTPFDQRIPQVTLVSSVATVNDILAWAVSPDNMAMYTLPGTPDCNNFMEVYSLAQVTAPERQDDYVVPILPGGGPSQSNQFEFQKTTTDDFIGCLPMQSEGVLLFSAKDPLAPSAVSYYDSNIAQGNFAAGASNCLALTNGDGSFFFRDTSLWVIRPKFFGTEMTPVWLFCWCFGSQFGRCFIACCLSALLKF